MRLSHYFFSLAQLRFGETPNTFEPECRCIPRDNCWPSTNDWTAFNHTVSGRLIKTVPPGSVCYPSQPDYDVEKCNFVLGNWTRSAYHSADPGSIRDPSWSGDRCPPLYRNGTSITGNTNARAEGCSLGNLSPYVVDVANASHVQAALKFAKDKNIRINIKNTGHHPIISAGYGSLEIWTHNMKSFQFHKSFTPDSCRDVEGHMAVTLGAGVQVRELFAWMATHNAFAPGATHLDVGVVGWATGGGHGYAATVYGMGADNILEAELVLTNGQVIKANQCQHPDLFWAIRGGGSGTYGVILSLTLKAYPMPSLAMVNMTLTPKKETSVKQWWRTIAELHKDLTELKEAGYGGYYTIRGPPFKFHETLVFHNVRSAKAAMEIIRPLRDKLAQENSTVQAAISSSWVASWYEAKHVLKDLPCPESVGTKRPVRASRLIPRRAIEDTDLLARTLERIGPGLHAPSNGVSSPIIAGTMSASKKLIDNALNPAWRDAAVHLFTTQEWDASLPDAVANETIHEMTYGKGYALRQLAPDSGAYINQANPYEPDWQWAFWGHNYPRLHMIKQKYDPDNLLWCRHCVCGGKYEERSDGALCKAFLDGEGL